MGANKQKSSEYVIKMVVRDDTDFLSPFSEQRVPVISADVADYLESNTPVSACKK